MMKKLFLVAALTLASAAAGYAQTTPTPSPRGITEHDPLREALRDPNADRRSERVISATVREFNRMEREAAAARRGRPTGTFKAQVAVTNNSPKAIKSVSWVTSLTDPSTGAVMVRYDIISDVRIAPGKTKKVTKKLPFYRSATGARKPDADNLKFTITRVTYEDGSTSDAP